MAKKNYTPKLKIILSNHTTVEKDPLDIFVLTLININNRPCSSVYLLPKKIECQNNRMIFLQFGFRMEENFESLVFKHGTSSFSLPKNFVHYVEDALTNQILWYNI